jgi:hypothetical protein
VVSIRSGTAQKTLISQWGRGRMRHGAILSL